MTRRDSIRLYGRLLRFLRPYGATVAITIVFMMGFAALSGFSLAMIIPFTEIILSGDTPAELVDRHGRMGAADDLRSRAEAAFYGAISGADRPSTVKGLCIAIFLVFLLKNVFWYAQSFLAVRIEQRTIRDIRNRVFNRYQFLSMDYFSRNDTGTLVSRVTNDVDLVRGAISNGFADLVRQGLLLLVYLITVLLANWQLFLLAVLVLPPNLWLIDRVGQSLRRSSGVSQTKMAGLTTVLTEAIGGMRIVKAFGLEGNRRDRFGEATDGYARVMTRMTRIGSLASPLTEMLGVLVAVVLLWVAGTQLSSDGTASGRFMLFIVGMLSMMQPIKSLSQSNIRIQQGLAAAERIFEVLDAQPTVREAAGARAISGLSDAIRFEGVDFHYRPDGPVLRGIDLVIPRGAVVALVGPSGGGKSTLTDLIPRLYDPTAGRITFDGVDLRSLKLSDLRAMIGVVSQETFLFQGTIRENIAMGREGAFDEEIEAAARAANAHDFTVALPDGYETLIGERGRLLSGGQRQRVSIARALLRNPPLLVFDEATSSLDSESEALVQEAVSRLLRHRTSVVVAHRLSTIRNADLIVVLSGGRIVQSGSHEQLMGEDGLYAKLVALQHVHPATVD